jgi:hypothetical protein
MIYYVKKIFVFTNTQNFVFKYILKSFNNKLSHQLETNILTENTY